MKLDMNEKGWASVFKPFEKKLIEAVYKHPSGMITLTGWKYLEGDRSRATVINTLARWKLEGILKSTTRTGKGGHHDVYSPVYPTVEELETAIKQGFINFMLEELEGSILE